MNNRKISRRSFLQVSAAALAAGALAMSASAAESEETNCLKKAPETETRCTQYGPVVGKDNGENYIWYGIPYGAAPVGALRWAAPEAPAAWTEPRDCSAISTMAYQYSAGPAGTEDCLKLDIYAPKKAKNLPVLVFIHGGNNQTGNTQEIIGNELVVKDECVFVSLDYRLGLFGFNCLPALQTGANETGNYTLLDIAKALDWVHDNIRSFGGDPDNVTISGFSAGGRDVMAMLTSPLFDGKFQKAVAFSGGMTIADKAASASQIAWAVAPLAVEDGVCPDTASAHDWLLTTGSDVRDWLYSVDSARLVPLCANAGIRMSVFPHLYGDDVVLPAEGFATRNYNNVPLIMLTGSTEFSMFNNFDGYYAGLDASVSQKAIDFGCKYGSDMYRIFNAECSAETMYENYKAPIYLCQVDFGGETSPSPISIMGFGAFHGIFVPMLSSVNNYSSFYDFSAAGYQDMAAAFNTYLRNFLYTGNPNHKTMLRAASERFRFSYTESNTAVKWSAWTPENKLSLVLDADAEKAIIAMKDVSTTYDEIMARMDADTTLPEDIKMGTISHVMNGRWFSDALDAHYGNPTLWK